MRWEIIHLEGDPEKEFTMREEDILTKRVLAKRESDGATIRYNRRGIIVSKDGTDYLRKWNQLVRDAEGR